MAKLAKTADDFDAYASELESFAKTLREISGEMRSASMPFHFAHCGTVESLHFPQIEKWVAQIKYELIPAKKAFQRGVKSRTEVVKDYKKKKAQKDTAEERKATSRK